MAAETRTPTEERQLRRFWMLVALGGIAAGIAAAAGVALWISDPADGTQPEEVLRFVAAITGLLTGALLGAAAIYAQVKNLWRFAPTWFRYTSWAVLAVIAIVAIASSALRES